MMKKSSLLMVAFALIFATSCKNDQKKNDSDSNMNNQTEMGSDMETDMSAKENNQSKKAAKKVTAKIEAKSDSGISGQVVFTEENGEVTMVATIEGLAEGTHAIHIHETPDCSSPDGKSAGGHWNPTFEPHGKWGAEEGFHRGDIGNFEANADGMAKVSMTTDLWCIGCGDEKKDILGHAVIVHDGVDDFTSQPSGAAGTRIGCAVIKKQ